jgi:hypothetical protein
MPSYIVKADPAQDFYVMWSTVVDAPCAFGTRAELARFYPGPDSAPERFARADEFGTSANWPNWPSHDMPFGWQDEEFIVMEGSPERLGEDGYSEAGCWLLPRGNLRAYCEELGAGRDGAELLRWHAEEEQQ